MGSIRKKTEDHIVCFLVGNETEELRAYLSVSWQNV
jgi:hypothetical protein